MARILRISQRIWAHNAIPFRPSSVRDRRATSALLARLAEAEQNATRLCSRMAPQPTDDELAEILRDRSDLHHARRQALGKLIERFGGSAPMDVECRVLLTRTSDAVDVIQTPEDVERALAILRDELGAEYRVALESSRLEEPQRSALAALAPA